MICTFSLTKWKYIQLIVFVVTAIITLEQLFLENTKMNEIPTEIGLLKDLKVLRIGKNNLKALPNAMSHLTNLEILGKP